MKLVLVLDNIRSCYNVGAILRTAEGFGIDKVILSGYTPRIHDESLLPHLRDKLDHEIHKTALGAEDLLTIVSLDNIKVDLVKYKKTGWQVIGLENNIATNNLLKLGTADIRKRLSDKIVLILGEEVKGIDHSLYDIVDLFLEIPMKGKKESFNVSVAAGIAMYAIMES
ncbi:TrmH family RNA methyltransferase [Candidatus Saccharibacteria bacterium]|nr:TrmH family RNA methyltransferase [Candidatus Saccharibacteria bacterium]